MAEELLVTLNRSDSTGFGFSLLGTAGLPHVIYDIVENSPAADSGKVSSFPPARPPPALFGMRADQPVSTRPRLYRAQ